jgi:membrane-bound lytic murein transglycosylase D
VQTYRSYLYPVIALLVFFSGCSHVPSQKESRNSSPSADDQAAQIANGSRKVAVPDPKTVLASIKPETGKTDEKGANPAEATESNAASESSVGIEELMPSNGMQSADETLYLEPSQENELDVFEAETTDENGHPKNLSDMMDESLAFCEASQEYWQKGELDKALEALDNAYILILSAATVDEESKYSQQIEDLRFMIAKRILEIYASRHIVVSGNHKEIPVVINHHVQSEINLFTTGIEKDFFLESYKRSGKYRPMIVEMLRQAGIPEELSWLPLIESGYKEYALSRARALGLWQFISSTGYKFGLKRDWYIDERLDPVKATRAAIDYLKELHQMFGDWTTVLAAYNCGEGRVLSIIRNQNVNYLDNFWDLYERLPRETARYVPRFLATLHIVNNLQKYGLDGVAVNSPPVFEETEINKAVHLNAVAEALGVSEYELLSLNPELRQKVLPNYAYPLRVPPTKSKVLTAKIDTIPIYTKPITVEVRRPRPVASYTTHKVKRGETLTSIACRYKASAPEIAKINRLNKKRTVVIGQTLKIPSSAYVSATRPRPAASASTAYKAKAPKMLFHEVKRGDSLWNIAKRYDVSTKDIQRINGLSSPKVFIGQHLKIPDAGSGAYEITNGKETYRAKPGDTAFYIARQHNMPLERFLRINQLTPKSKILAGGKYYVE